jgi:hypothetical protein
MNLSFTQPSRTEASGPLKGSEEIDTDVAEPFIAKMSGSTFLSDARTMHWTWTSLKKPFGKRGLIGRSMSLEVSTSLSVGFPSLLRKPPGNFPAAAARSR